MSSCWRIFSLEAKAILRSRTLLFLTGASLVWTFLAPHLLTGDGTPDGARELAIRFSLGAVAALCAVTLVIASAGSIARERAAKRLALTMVRPVRYFAIALGKIAAYALTGAFVLGLATAVEALRNDWARPCQSVVRPVLPTVREEAVAMYDSYLADIDTPDEIKKAPRAVVLRILERKAVDHYQTIPTNGMVRWNFPSVATKGCNGAIRFKFTNTFDMRDDVRGVLGFDGRTMCVSNVTRNVMSVPVGSLEPKDGGHIVTFLNRGRMALMLRPRKDLSLLVPADGFAANLFRAYVQLVSIVTLIIAFGVFLGSGLGRATAVFTAIVMLLVGELAPSIDQSCTEEMNGNFADRASAVITGFTLRVTHPLSSVSPLSALAADERIELTEVFRTLATNAIVLPVMLALLAALVMPLREGDNG